MGLTSLAGEFMFYRVDYLLAVILVGGIIGWLLGRRASRIASAVIARWYFVAVVVLLALTAVVFVHGVVLDAGPGWNRAGGIIGDVGKLFFGMLFGLTLRRSDRLELLREPAISSALCLATGYTFVTAGYVKAFQMQGMTEFFTQSGYTAGFLKFIMTIEVLGGMAMLVPWAVPLGIAGLSVDMFGAFYTHIHNGDPLNDSTGAIGMLMRLGAIAIFWALRQDSAGSARAVRKSLFAVGVAAVICMVIAVGGSEIVRHHRSPTAPQAAHP